MMQWLRRNFIAGFFVTVPLIISVAALVWIFGVIDGFTNPVTSRILGRQVPGLGILFTLLFVVLVGLVATNVIGRRLLATAEHWLMKVPVFRTIYAPVRQLVAAFSPDNEYGFKRVVMVDEPGRGLVLGFVTKEFSVERGRGAEVMLAVYVPTNHLYLGDVVLCAPSRVFFPDVTVEEGIRIFLTGGMSLPDRLSGHDATDRPKEARS
ncbi:MAG: DUF502 domain-containing protein [Vicinamibacterales bacterium]